MTSPKQDRPKVKPLRTQEASVESKIQHDFQSLVQQWFMEYNRVLRELDPITGRYNLETEETDKQKKVRMSKFLSRLAREFLDRYPEEIKSRNSFQDLIPVHFKGERKLSNNSIFINQISLNTTGSTDENLGEMIEDVDLREKVYEEIFGIIDHAWRAMHSGMYAKDVNEIAERIKYADTYWNGENGRQQLEIMGLDAEAIRKDRAASPLLFGPAEQLNPLPTLLAANQETDIVGAVEKANSILEKIIGMYVQLTQLVPEKILLCLPTLIFDQVSAYGPTVNMHFHTSQGNIVGLFSNNELRLANRMPMITLSMKVRPEPKMNPKTGMPEFRKGELSLKGAVEKIDSYLQKIAAGDIRMSGEKSSLAKKFLAVLKDIYSEYENRYEVNYSEFILKFNAAYLKAFFPSVPIPTKFIDEQKNGRFGNFIKYIKDMDKFVEFMTHHKFLKNKNELLLRVSHKKNDGTYTKFARYFWNSETQRFEINQNDKRDSESEIANLDNGKFKSLKLEEVQDSNVYVAIPLKSVEYMSLGLGLIPKMLFLDDGVFFPAFRELPEATRNVMGGPGPLFGTYEQVDPTKTGY